MWFLLSILLHLVIVYVTSVFMGSGCCKRQRWVKTKKDVPTRAPIVPQRTPILESPRPTSTSNEKINDFDQTQGKKDKKRKKNNKGLNQPPEPTERISMHGSDLETEMTQGESVYQGSEKSQFCTDNTFSSRRNSGKIKGKANNPSLERTQSQNEMLPKDQSSSPK